MHAPRSSQVLADCIEALLGAWVVSGGTEAAMWLVEHLGLLTVDKASGVITRQASAIVTFPALDVLLLLHQSVVSEHMLPFLLPDRPPTAFQA